MATKSDRTVPTFCVQAFHAKGRGIEPEAPTAADDEAHALRLGERHATRKAGVVVLRHDSDPSLGDFDEAVVIAIHGRVPPIFQDLPF